MKILGFNSIKKVNIYSSLIGIMVLMVSLTASFMIFEYQRFEQEAIVFKEQYTSLEKQRLKTIIDKLVERVKFNKQNKEKMFAWLKQVRFKQYGYIFVLNSKGNMLIHPTRAGQNVANITDPNGINILQALIKASKEDGFVKYTRKKSSNGVLTSKLSYVRYLENWDLLIATGIYLDEIEIVSSQNKQKLIAGLKRHMLWMILISFFIASIAFLIAYLISKRINIEFNLFAKGLKQSTTQHRLLNLNKFKIGEFQALADTANKVINKRKDAEDLLQQHHDAERQRVENMLREKEIQYLSIFNAARDAFIISDFDGNIVEGNPQACQMYGYNYDELIKLSTKNLVHPDYYYNFKRFIFETQNKGEFETESLDIRKDATIFNVDVRGSTFEYKGKVHILRVVRDITERKQMEENLAQAKEVAETSNRAKSVFLANMSHELRTPLNGILGFTQILHRDKTLNERQVKAINTIHKSGEHLLILLNDILDLSKVEAGKMELQPKTFDFEVFIKGIADIIQIRAQEKDIIFNCEISENLPHAVITDDTRLRQILINLLGNAVKFTDKGKVVFKIHRYMDKIRFQVEDTGCGIAYNELEVIFKPFQQVGNQKQMPQGTGLGLSISNKLVKIMESTLKVNSILSKGTVFWFDLKLAEATGWQPPNEIQQRNIIGFYNKPHTILIVDDKEANRAILVNLLDSIGFDIIEASDGEEGIEKAITEKPALIFMDLIMPGVNGFEATRKIRAQLNDVIIIAASASAFEQHRQESFTAGCNDFIAKPINSDELLEKIRQYLKLEWMFEAKAKLNKVKQALVQPPAEIMKNLSHYAKQGNIGRITKEVIKLEKMDSKYQAFAAELRSYCSDFDINKIRNFLK
ncbi:ATP-binding protein [Candidatus Marithrix sp. Canyon 246]|uniref:ATP-binding protein n=1 Tax=Candidatus Marithrix sp. Canyon 246 TaxID=1827136 RepID=UPI00084A0861|nr:ATP-binding protein [Candidatus Marithrix sp. Canyon 246]